MVLWILLLIAVVLVGAVWFCIAPAASTPAQRAPFQNRNFAHRGLFTKDQTVPENSLAAFDAAATAGYGIELDVQFTKDRQLIVFHDDTMDRMTGAHGWVNEFTLAQVQALPLKGTAQHAPLFSQVLATVGGRVPLIVEIKSRSCFDKAYLDDLCTATMALLHGYSGAYCVESFDPRVVGWLRRREPAVLRGQLSDTATSFHKDGAAWLPAVAFSRCFGNVLGRPQFIAWGPAPRNRFIRAAMAMGAMKVMWTALPEQDAQRLQRENDAVIFQWYRPETGWEQQPR